MLELPKGSEQEISFPVDEDSKEIPGLQVPHTALFKQQQNQNILESTGFHGGSTPTRGEFKIVLWSLVAAVIDGLLLIALSSLFLISFALTMRLGFQFFLLRELGSWNIIKLYFAIFAIASWLYLITTRAFLGCSLGEKVCDLRLGTPLDRISNLYIFRVILRNTLVLATGILLIPILSVLVARDIAGRISGLSLFSIK